MIKWCPKCKTFKKITEFYKNSIRGSQSYCKFCSYIYIKHWKAIDIGNDELEYVDCFDYIISTKKERIIDGFALTKLNED